MNERLIAPGRKLRANGLPERRRAASQIQRQIENPAADALNEFCFLMRRNLKMQSPQNACPGIVGYVGLNYLHRGARVRKRFFAKCAREYTPLIHAFVKLHKKRRRLFFWSEENAY
jgi:hypothetical protein